MPLLLSRRTFAFSSAAALLHARIDPFHKGVRLGVQSYSFRDRSLDDAIAAMKQLRIGCVEMWSGHAEPNLGRDKRDELRKWRLSVDLAEFRKIRAKFKAAGIDLYAYNYSFRDDFSDEEIDRGFLMAKALGVKAITASANVSTARRVAPFAARHRMPVAMHNHSNIRPNEFARPDDFAEAMQAGSFIKINLDIGHFLAAGFDPVDFLSRNHANIVTLHIKDRKKNQGANVVFGEGDTPIREVLALLRDRKLKIPANIEYEYKGADTVAEVGKCLDYCRKALSA
jgi:sugar phosphate isomerase/epimerase